jgi:hypothetical protein
MKYNQKTISSDVPYPIVPAEPARVACLIVATADFFLGDSAVTAITGLLVKAGIPYPIESCGAIYGITASGPSTVSFLDQKYANRGPDPSAIQ